MSFLFFLGIVTFECHNPPYPLPSHIAVLEPVFSLQEGYLAYQLNDLFPIYIKNKSVFSFLSLFSTCEESTILIASQTRRGLFPDSPKPPHSTLAH